eukprot:CAMPEP_0181326932 /NCGR_PEP_ID=MMETSP1101-20121128/21793_1 /TAXON_ID=46948 /ORGANISM="Rhodomonas abbreviata, Strain Caron Lab Isolate" /LENGTH=76 /DNA_ID=CAMNT_0023435481 /DNA_START=29 /DNA_END=256 /DNA_ORIENTATION=+
MIAFGSPVLIDPIANRHNLHLRQAFDAFNPFDNDSIEAEPYFFSRGGNNAHLIAPVSNGITRGHSGHPKIEDRGSA